MDEQQKVTEEIPKIDTEDPRPPSPTDRPTTPNPPDRPAEVRADLELINFRIEVEARKQRRKEARVLIDQFLAQDSMTMLVPRKKLCGRLGGWPGRKKRELE